MKKIVLLLLVLLTFIGCTNSQISTVKDPETGLNTYTGNIKLSSLKSQSWYDSIEVVEGSVSIGYHLGTDDHAGMRNLKEINGDLILDNQVLLTTIEFPLLEKVSGDVKIVGSRYSNVLSKLDLSSLKEVGGDFIYSGMQHDNGFGVEILGLFSLESIGGSLQIEGNKFLGSVSAKNLVSIGGDIEILLNKKLALLDLDNLEYVEGEMIISGNESLIIVDTPNLKEVSYGEITDNLHLVDKKLKLVLLNQVEELEVDTNVEIVEKWN